MYRNSNIHQCRSVFVFVLLVLCLCTRHGNATVQNGSSRFVAKQQSSSSSSLSSKRTVVAKAVDTPVVDSQNGFTNREKRSSSYHGDDVNTHSGDNILRHNESHIHQTTSARNKRQSPPGGGFNPNLLSNQNAANFGLTNGNTANLGLTNQFTSSNAPPSSSNDDAELRHRLLMTLENRLQERNMLLHDNEVLREKELLREKEMNSLLTSHPSLLAGSGNSLLGESLTASRKSIIENNGLFSKPLNGLTNNFDSNANNLINGHNLLESNLMNPVTGTLSDEERLLAAERSQMAMPGVGSLGDEASPFGSLGLSKSGYIPVGRVEDNQVGF